jgi:hypothetical protein
MSHDPHFDFGTFEDLEHFHYSEGTGSGRSSVKTGPVRLAGMSGKREYSCWFVGHR